MKATNVEKTPANKSLSPEEAAVLLAEQYRLLVAPGQVVELLALNVQRGGGRPHVEAGFFDYDHLADMAKTALQISRYTKGVYFTLNPLNPDLLARRCNRIDWANEGELAKDKDVLCRRWLLVDADPVRDPFVSATDQEKAVAYQTILDVREFLRSRFWPDPLLADSGNGFHLLYPIDLPTEETPRPQATPPTPVSNNAGKGYYTSQLLVDRWLTERGIAFRIKSELEGKGRAVYVLQQCPFDPSHSDPDACIMQDAHGKMSAQCFHNSCKGRGWQQFKEAIGAPERHHYDPPLSAKPSRKRSLSRRQRTDQEATLAKGMGRAISCTPPDGPPLDIPSPPPGVEASPPGLPTIQGNQRQLRDVTDDALTALLACNDPPTLFQRGGVLTRLRICEDNAAPVLEPLTDAALRGVLARVANWLKARPTKEGIVLEEDAPPMEVVKDLAHLPHWEGIPVLEAVVETPVFTRNGDLLRSPAFHPAARLWYHPSGDLVVPDVPLTPSPDNIERARHLLLVELLGDFPFEDDASKAHALAALLLPFVRQMIDGPTPLHLLDAPVEGTGKTLLASCLSEVSTGRPVEAIAEASDDEEWRKRLTAVLIEGPTIVLLDNLNRILDSGALASLLTARVWKDRILGVSKTVRAPNLAVWLASGNNTRLSRELIRRTIWCRLDARTDAPWERTGFRHKNLMKWTKEHRGELLWAALVMCQAWIAVGQPAGEQTLGMFESWAETMGGILQVAGVPGLLANAQTFRQQSADTAGEWRAFVAAWWARFREAPVGVKDLFQLVNEEKLLDAVLGDKGEASQRIRLGRALGKARDRVVGEYRICGGEEDHSCRQTYRLQRVASSAPATETGSDTFELCG